MRRPKLNAGAGFVLGLGAALVLVVTVASTGAYGWQVCQVGENWITCGREWANVIAILATVATILILISQQRLQRETAVLQTLEVRSRMVEGERTLFDVHNVAEGLQMTAMLWEAGTRDPPITPAKLSHDLLRLERLLRADRWERIAGFDRAAIEQVQIIAPFVDDLLRRMFGGNLEYARNATPNVHPSDHVAADWMETIDPSELYSLSKRLFGFHRETIALVDAINGFEASEYFAQQMARTKSTRRMF